MWILPQQKSTVDGSVVLWTAIAWRPYKPQGKPLPQSSCMVVGLYARFHMPDGQINVNIKNLEQLVARYPSLKGYAIDSKETTLHTVS